MLRSRGPVLHTRARSYDRALQTSAGEVNLKVPKLRRQTFETAIIERYRRPESSVEEALIDCIWRGFQCGGTLPKPPGARGFEQGPLSAVRKTNKV
jgi:hypothetical protein